MASQVPTPTDYPYDEYDFYAHYGRQLIKDIHKLQMPGPFIPPNIPTDSLNRGEIPTPKVFLHNIDSDMTIKPIGIIGAGVGGLYTALILDSLGIDYDILEASQRTGGRLLTHKFPGNDRYDYYDVGAMRFPKAPKGQPCIMTRLFNLFSYHPLNTGNIQLERALRPFYFESKDNNAFLLYNNVRARQNDPRPTFKAEELGVGEDFIKVGTEEIGSDVLGPFARGLWKDLEDGTDQGWRYMQLYDAYSMRGYMTSEYRPSESLRRVLLHRGLPTNVINWCETFDSPTGAYDRALTEAVLDQMAFSGNGKGKLTWWCLDGGSRVLSDSMTTYITQRNSKALLRGMHVTAIIPVKSLTNLTKSSSLKVMIAGKPPRTYSHVISTLPLTCLRVLDISQCDLTPKQSNAMRELQYGPAFKIGIRFKTAWWTEGNIKIVGGQSFTDRPIRTVVYPSYDNGNARVLIASYCRADDAERLGALIGTGEASEKQLKNLVLRDLAALHDVTVDFLEQNFMDIHSYDWSRDPLSMGAFAFFGPGKFGDLYSSMNSPAAKGRLHFAGEALSVRHGWVVGALDSAWRAVYEYLLLADRPKLPKFFKLWGRNQEWTRHTPTKVPVDRWEEYNSRDDLLLENILLTCPELY